MDSLVNSYKHWKNCLRQTGGPTMLTTHRAAHGERQKHTIGGREVIRSRCVTTWQWPLASEPLDNQCVCVCVNVIGMLGGLVQARMKGAAANILPLSIVARLWTEQGKKLIAFKFIWQMDAFLEFDMPLIALSCPSLSRLSCHSSSSANPTWLLPLSFILFSCPFPRLFLD